MRLFSWSIRIVGNRFEKLDVLWGQKYFHCSYICIRISHETGGSIRSPWWSEQPVLVGMFSHAGI